MISVELDLTMQLLQSGMRGRKWQILVDKKFLRPRMGRGGLHEDSQGHQRPLRSHYSLKCLFFIPSI